MSYVAAAFEFGFFRCFLVGEVTESQKVKFQQLARLCG